MTPTAADDGVEGDDVALDTAIQDLIIELHCRQPLSSLSEAC